MSDVFENGIKNFLCVNEYNERIYRTVLSPEQVEKLYQAFKARLAQEAAVNLFPNDPQK